MTTVVKRYQAVTANMRSNINVLLDKVLVLQMLSSLIDRTKIFRVFLAFFNLLCLLFLAMNSAADDDGTWKYSLTGGGTATITGCKRR